MDRDWINFHLIRLIHNQSDWLSRTPNSSGAALRNKTFIHFLHPPLLHSGSQGGAWACPSCQWAKAELHPWQVASLSHKKTDRQPFALTLPWLKAPCLPLMHVFSFNCGVKPGEPRDGTHTRRTCSNSANRHQWRVCEVVSHAGCLAVKEVQRKKTILDKRMCWLEPWKHKKWHRSRCAKLCTTYSTCRAWQCDRFTRIW